MQWSYFLMSWNGRPNTPIFMLDSAGAPSVDTSIILSDKIENFPTRTLVDRTEVFAGCQNYIVQIYIIYLCLILHFIH